MKTSSQLGMKARQIHALRMQARKSWLATRNYILLAGEENERRWQQMNPFVDLATTQASNTVKLMVQFANGQFSVTDESEPDLPPHAVQL